MKTYVWNMIKWLHEAPIVVVANSLEEAQELVKATPDIEHALRPESEWHYLATLNWREFLDNKPNAIFEGTGC